MRILILLACLFPLVSFAGSQGGKITQLIARSDNLHYFFLEGTPTNRPDCALSQNYWMIKDENSVAGKTQISMLLTAYASGKAITVVGTGECTRWSDGEDVSYIKLENP